MGVLLCAQQVKFGVLFHSASYNRRVTASGWGRKSEQLLCNGPTASIFQDEKRYGDVCETV